MLDAGGDVIIVNAVTDDEDVRVLSAVLVRHYADGEIEKEIAHDLDVATGESVVVEATQPRDVPLVAVEVLLRMTGESDMRIAEGYAIAQTPLVEGMSTAEFKLINRGETLASAEFAIRDASSYAIATKVA
jgi:hypothetical protein